MAYHSFEELDVWKRACRLAVNVSKTMSGSREFALRDQMCRAAVSVPSNIAEGSERDSTQDYIRFIRIAKGSAAELRTQCYIALELQVVEKTTAKKFANECKEISAMLQGLIRSLQSQTKKKLKSEH